MSTKALAYQQILESGKAGSQRVEIAKYLKSHGSKSRRDLAVEMGYDLSAVCGRVNDLIASGAVEVTGTKTCKYSGKLVEVVGIVTEFTPQNQELL